VTAAISGMSGRGGRDWPKNIEPTYSGYSIGRWIDEHSDGRYDVLRTKCCRNEIVQKARVRLSRERERDWPCKEPRKRTRRDFADFI
jgi:hypothetical protein